MGTEPAGSATAGLSWRPLVPGDAAASARFFNAVEAAAGSTDFTTEQDMAEELTDPEVDYPRGSVGGFDGDVLACVGVLIPRPEAPEVHHMRFFGGVDPGYRRRGLGTRITDWAEAAALPLHQERFPGQGLTLSAWSVSTNQVEMDMLAGRGYQPVRRFFDMVRDLSAPIAPDDLPPEITVVRYSPDRFADTLLIHNEAFRDHWGSLESSPESWEHFVTGASFRPDLCVIAYEGDEPLSLVFGSDRAEVSARLGRRELHIPLVATRRAGRKRGLASGLLSRLMVAAREAGYEQCSLGVDSESPTGALGLYERAGFTTRVIVVTQRKTLLPRGGAASGPGSSS